jgi:hypothetical protein
MGGVRLGGQENEKLVDDLDLAINEIEKDNHHQVYPVSRQILMLSGMTDFNICWLLDRIETAI